MIHALIAAAVFATRPPDGTYAYSLGSGASTTLAIAAHNAGVIVQERFSAPGLDELTTTSYDAATLAQTSYFADAISGGKSHAEVTFGASQVVLNADGQMITMKADPSAPQVYYFDSLMSLLAMMPSIEHQTHVQSITVATNRGKTQVVKISQGAVQPRPESAPAIDAAMSLDFGSVKPTIWYNPKTLVMDAYAQPGVVALLTHYDPALQALQPLVERTPLPLPAAHFSSEDVTFTSADGTKLAGTVTMPSPSHRRVGAFVFVHGSGPENRDEAIGPNHIFEQLANALSNDGYAVLRYDKRGIAKSGGNAATATRDQLVADAHAAITFLREHGGIDPKRVYVLGHSEGAEIAPTLAIEDRAIHGLVLIGAPALPLDQVLMQQATRGLKGDALASAAANERRLLDQIKAGKNPIPGSAWLRSSFAFDPAKNIARVTVPMLILQGGKDFQVLPKDLPRLVNAARATHRDVTVRLFPNDDHLMIGVPGSQPSTGAEYFTPAYIDPAVIAAIRTWLKAH